VSEAEPDLDAFVGELLHDFGDSDGLAVVAIGKALPASGRHDGGLEDGTGGLDVVHH